MWDRHGASRSTYTHPRDINLMLLPPNLDDDIFCNLRSYKNQFLAGKIHKLQGADADESQMFFFEDFGSLLFTRFRGQLSSFSERLLVSIATTNCAAVEEVEECRDDEVAWRLKMVAFATILVAGAAGVAIPLVGRKMRTDGGLFFFVKAFAAGVVLATGFVHMLHAAESSFANPCLPDSPWRAFPFAGFVAMVASLGTLVVDFVGTQYYERKHGAAGNVAPVPTPTINDEEKVDADVSAAREAGSRKDPMHIVGMHAHAAEHRHSHAHVHGACQSHAAPHGRDYDHEDDREASHDVRHVVASQILELGIVSHSVIIGLSLGVSQSPCTIRPLIAALAFHQFFEGFALGGCISQARFRNAAAATMAAFFAITTPAGIAVGAGVASSYDASSPRALVIEGLLDAMSAGILIYTALVDLIAADFLSRTMSCNARLQVASYGALFLGAGAMAALAIWA